jgi:hypothetical protein
MNIMVKVGEFVLAMEQPKKLLFIRSSYDAGKPCLGDRNNNAFVCGNTQSILFTTRYK